jgi:hypothetical protein
VVAADDVTAEGADAGGQAPRGCRLHALSPRVCHQRAKRRWARTVAELGTVSGHRRGASADLAAAYRPLCWAAGHVSRPRSPERAGGAGHGGRLHVHWAYGAAGVSPRLHTPPVGRGASHQDVCEHHDPDSRGLRQGAGHHEGGNQDHRPHARPPTLPAAPRSRPRALSTRSERHGGVAHLAPNLWRHP